MIVWVHYGFEGTPPKMYNMNVACPILLSFVKAAAIKDIEDYCKQKNIQLGIELDALRKRLQSRRASVSTPVEPSAPAPAPPAAAEKPAEKPQPGKKAGAPAGSSRPNTPGTTRIATTTAPTEDPNDEMVIARRQKEGYERQLEIVNIASRMAKELAAGTAHVDLADQDGNRLRLDQAGAEKAKQFLSERMHYNVVKISTSETGDVTEALLKFVLSIPT